VIGQQFVGGVDLDNRSNSGAIILPYSGQIIGTIVDALDIEDGVLVSRTAKRYYSGSLPCEYSQKEIFKAFGKAMVDKGILPVPPGFKKYNISMPDITANAAWRFARKWDILSSTIQSRSAPLQNPGRAVEGFCRLVAVDLSLRIFALLRLVYIPVQEPHVPMWAMENGAGKLLREFLDRTGISRDQFAARVEVSPTSIDNWLDGKTRPTPSHIKELSGELAKLNLGKNAELLQLELTRQFTFAYLADILARQIGRDTVVELGTALNRFVWLITDDVRQQNRRPIEEAAGLEYNSLRYGTDEPFSHTLLRNLALIETDKEWKRDILAATMDWSLRFQEIMAESSWPRSSAGLAEDIEDTPEVEEDLRKLNESSKLQARDYLRISQGDLGMLVETLNGGISDCRIIVKHHPLSPKAHFTLGSQLGMVGKWLNNRRLVAEGISECKIAAALREGWDAPLVEIGIILGNIGEYEKALVELDTAVMRLKKKTPHLAFCRGYNLMELGRNDDALKEFKAVIDTNPQYALALNYAAQCAFSVGDSEQGRKYAKEAFNLGEFETYNAWRKGKYKKQI
jgi:tetratricopeptide (TPR) repeat protein